MAPGRTRPEGPSMPRRWSSTSRRCAINDSSSKRPSCGHNALHSAVPAVLALCLAFLPPAVGAQDTLKAVVPPEVTLCIPVNLTWSGGTPPYRLDVEPFVNGFQNTTANQRTIGIQNTWILWTPEFPPGSRLLVTVYPSGTGASSGNSTSVLPSSDSSCLNDTSFTASMAPSAFASSSAANGPLTSIAQPPATSSSPASLASSGGGLNKGTIAGIAVAVILIGFGLIALATWYPLRRRKRVHQLEKGCDRNIVSPAFSDDAPTIPYTGLSSTLASASADPSKVVPPTSSSGSPDAPEDLLRPTPYVVPREFTTSLSQSRRAGGKKHVRELSEPASTLNESAANLSATVPDAHAMSSSPSQVGPDADDSNSRSGGGDGGGDVIQFDPDGTARLSAVRGGLGLGFSDVGASDVASSSGEATLPPPYTQVPFQGRV